MINLEGQRPENQAENESRRNFLKTLGVSALVIACGGYENAFSQTKSRYGEKWHYSAESMRDVYEREYNGEKILRNCFRIEAGQIIGATGGREFVVPREFVDRILAHLTQMLESGALNYIFRLDAFHGHPFLDTELFRSRYDVTNNDPIYDAKIITSDKNVFVLYHNSEHLAVDGADESSLSTWSKRNVIGKMSDDNMVYVPIPQETKRTAISTPDGTTDLSAYIKFAANKDGVFVIRTGDKEIRLDISLDDNSYY